MAVALTYRQVKDTGKTLAWTVHSSDGVFLGDVSWYSQWRRYVLFPNDGMLFDADCLRDITGFIEARMRDHKAKAKT